MVILSKIALSLLFLAIATIADAAMDKIQFHFSRSIFSGLRNSRFWNPYLSHANKWKNGDSLQGEKFWGSSRWFVALTDAWHAIQWVQLWFYFATAAIWIPRMLPIGSFWWFLLVLVGSRIVFGLFWVLCFDIVFNKKPSK